MKRQLFKHVELLYFSICILFWSSVCCGKLCFLSIWNTVFTFPPLSWERWIQPTLLHILIFLECHSSNYLKKLLVHSLHFFKLKFCVEFLIFSTCASCISSLSSLFRRPSEWKCKFQSPHLTIPFSSAFYFFSLKSKYSSQQHVFHNTPICENNPDDYCKSGPPFRKISAEIIEGLGNSAQWALCGTLRQITLGYASAYCWCREGPDAASFTIQVRQVWVRRCVVG